MEAPLLQRASERCLGKGLGADGRCDFGEKRTKSSKTSLARLPLARRHLSCLQRRLLPLLHLQTPLLHLQVRRTRNQMHHSRYQNLSSTQMPLSASGTDQRLSTASNWTINSARKGRPTSTTRFLARRIWRWVVARWAGVIGKSDRQFFKTQICALLNPILLLPKNSQICAL